MSETKKIIPTIANYFSDNDNVTEEDLSNNIVTPQVHTNYAEWKRLKKTSSHVHNDYRSINRPLADISSSEEDYNFDDNEPIFKIMGCLSDRNELRWKNENLIKKNKKPPSHFLLFSRMKQQIHFDCSFGDFCHIAKASWENMETGVNEDLMGDIDRRIRDYDDSLQRFRKILLPESTATSKINTCKPAAPPTVAPPLPVVEEQEPEVILTLEPPEPCDNPQIDTVIPTRLQHLAGEASVYHAPEKSKRINYHEFKSSRLINTFTPDNSLANIDSVNCDQNCNYPDCENSPIEDYRWNGQYCSAKCLIKDCHASFTGWLTDQQQQLPLTNGDQSKSTDIEQEIVLCLASPSVNSDDSLPINDTDLNILGKHQNVDYSNGITPGNRRPKIGRGVFRNNSRESNMIQSNKRQSVVNNSSKLNSQTPLDDFELCCDNKARDFVT